MQKKIIALAVAGLVSGAAFAQSNVTVYGQMNLAYQRTSGTYQNAGVYKVGAANTETQNALASADSRIGFKGEEDLGNGLKAVFTAEYQVAADQNGTALSTDTGTSGLGANARQTFVGLKGGWGTFTMGRQYTPIYEAAQALDPFGAAGANVASAYRIHPLAAVARANNSFKYVGVFPAGGGVVVVAGMAGLSERTTADSATVSNDTGKLYNWKLAYAGGPLLVGITGIKLYNNVAGITPTSAEGALGLPAGTLINSSTKSLAMGGTYDFGPAKLHVIHNRVDVDTPVGQAAERRDWLLGVSIPMGAHTIKAAYNRVDEKATLLGTNNNDANHWGLGYSYAMSKRTSLFANYAKISNKGNATFNIESNNSGLGTTGLVNAAGNHTTGLQLGMAHSF